MKAKTGRVYEMCVRALRWVAAHPDDEAGFGVLLAQLQVLVTRLGQLVTDQRNGRVDSRSARERKRELRREMLAGPIAHLARIAALAVKEVPDLRVTFVFKPEAGTLLAFQAAARDMFNAAQAHLEVLVKHGLSESVLVQFGKLLDEFDAAMGLGATGRTTHTAATRELEVQTRQAAAIVKAMDARIRLRFQDDLQALEQWISASTVLGTPERSAKDEEDTPAVTGSGSSPVSGSPGSGQAQGVPSGPRPNAGGDVRPAA